MLGGASDGTRNSPDSRRKRLQFSCNLRENALQSSECTRAARGVTRGRRGGACRRRRRRRSCGGAGSRRSRRRGARRRGRRARSAAPGPTTGRTCPSAGAASPSWSVSTCRSSPSARVVGRRARRSSVFVGRELGSSSSSVGSVVAGRAGVVVAAAARVGLALLREGERAEDLFLRARVVEHVGRQALDRLAVAMERVDLVDPAVVVPVRDRPVAHAASPSPPPAAAASERRQRGAIAAGAPSAGASDGMEDSMHDGMRAARFRRRTSQVSAAPLSRW